jgi:rubrerythrin
MGNLFYRKQPISEIKKLRFAELREWNTWHEIMNDAEARVKCSKCGNVYDNRKNNKCPLCGE